MVKRAGKKITPVRGYNRRKPGGTRKVKPVRPHRRSTKIR